MFLLKVFPPVGYAELLALHVSVNDNILLPVHLSLNNLAQFINPFKCAMSLSEWVPYCSNLKRARDWELRAEKTFKTAE